MDFVHGDELSNGQAPWEPDHLGPYYRCCIINAGWPTFAEASVGSRISPPKLHRSVGGKPAVPSGAVHPNRERDSTKR
jgi:hypothetical protein